MMFSRAFRAGDGLLTTAVAIEPFLDDYRLSHYYAAGHAAAPFH